MELLKPDGQPERQLVQYEALQFFMGHPIDAYLRSGRAKGSTSKDRWGVTISWPEDQHGAMPITTDDVKVCPDVTRWRETVHAPDLRKECAEGWEEFVAQMNATADPTKVRTAFMGTGIFEQCHYLMGFEDTLTNLYTHPDEMHELIDYITEYRIDYANMLIDKLDPEALFTHDDWGTRTALFMKPEMWREFYKEPYRRFYGAIRDRGVIAIHHADSYCNPIVEDMAEIGIQMWQGVLPENNIPELQERLKGTMILMGGVGAAIDRPDSEEPEIREYVRAVLAEDCPGGHFIPCITYGLPGTVYPHVDPFIDEEIEAYNRKVHLPKTVLPPVARRVTASVKQEAEEVKEEAEESRTLAQISQALRRGQRRRVMQLCEQALSEGIPAQEILSEGLVEGMTLLGDDFSASRAFVPEMLMAAKCMNEATNLLKPHLVGEGSGHVGRVCLGTVRGDMHDIGKNLVKIMMEGAGLEVVDLGVDVSAEKFVNTAIEQSCDIIACSSLLTTSMMEMRTVVEVAKEKGIRDKVKILVGGAPITQAFCDEIGADAYTEDAAKAAKTAVELLRGA